MSNYQLWAFDDNKLRALPAKRITSKKQIVELNKEGYGIFATVNKFNQFRRENDLADLVAFYADFDDGTKEEQQKTIAMCPTPTRIVESRNGFHCYWQIKNNMIGEYGINALENYKFVQQLIVNCTGADKSVKDAARVLRVPGTMHMKGEPFEVKEVFNSDKCYHAEDMLRWFKAGYYERTATPINIGVSKLSDGQFWDNITRYGATEGLRKISGAEELRGDTFEVTNNQIYVNGEFTSSWIDEEGNIGSHGNGGPTIVQWIMWYGHDKGTAAAIIKKYIPEIEACAITLNF